MAAPDLDDLDLTSDEGYQVAVNRIWDAVIGLSDRLDWLTDQLDARDRAGV